MPADRLAPVATLEMAIAKVLAGTPLTHAATQAGLEAVALADAVEVYQQAGRRALQERTSPGWWQVYVRFPDWDLAEQTAADHLMPLLMQAESEGTVALWWFIRKHPYWRLRFRGGVNGQTMATQLSAALDTLTTTGKIRAWLPGVYEAETAAFGGHHGMDIAHDLFHSDSRAILTVPAGNETELGRREVSLLLCSTLMRAAQLEWYEQGDVWHRVTQERPLAVDIPTNNVTAMGDAVKKLLLIDTASDGALISSNGPLATIADWTEAFRRTGDALGAAARKGILQRGLREVLSYLVIFHWNRLGLHFRTQSILAAAAYTAIL